MSIPLAPEPSATPTGLRAMRVHAAVALAYWVGLLPPTVIAAVLRRLSASAPESSVDDVSLARAQVCAVSARCAGQGCLQRSIAVMILCRLDGHSPMWRTGYRTEPFFAHAWVEVGGVPVDESDDVRSFTTVLSARPTAGRYATQGGLS